MPKPRSKQTESTKTVQKKGGAAAQAQGRKVMYPKPTTELRLVQNATALTVVGAKKILGWEEETEENKFGADYIRELVGLYSKKVRCTNNITNRPLTKSILLTLKQEILRKHWQYNGETIIIGCTGLVLNGQHTLIALVLAAAEIANRPDKWSNYWKVEPTVDKLIAYGVSEDDEIVNTMDTCKPRSLAEVMYRSAYFADVVHKDRKTAASMAAYAIKVLWDRTGAKLNAYAPLRTHSESLDFIERHPKIVQCVEHIFEENGDRQISHYISPGVASGLLYLMACATSDGQAYHAAEYPNESLLDWKLWSKACDFFVLLAGSSPSILEVSKAFGRAIDNGKDSHAERCAILVKAWLRYLSNKPITSKDLKLRYKKDEDGYDQLEEYPPVGGIDYGKCPEAEEASEPAPSDPTPKEISTRARAVQDAKKAKQAKKSKPKAKLSSGKAAKLIGKMAWVEDADGNHWRGKVVEASGRNARLKVAQGFEGAGNTRTALVADLRAKQPT